MAWAVGYSQILYDAGGENIVTCINPHHGGAPFGKPLVLFYCKTPKGNKLLVWKGLPYYKANVLGLIPGSAPGGDHGIPEMLPEDNGFIEVADCDSYASKRVFDLVDVLKRAGYEYDFLPIMGGALYTDNNPVDDRHCGLLDGWNEKYGNGIEIVTATADEFFPYLKQAVTELPTYEGDLPDWWKDDCLATSAGTKIFRNAQRTQKLIHKLGEGGIVTKEERE